MRRWTARPGALVVPVMLVIGWTLFAPTQVGGSTTYVMAEGVSMLPTYHGGDLVVLRRESSYEVGEVVAYIDPHIGRILHRIVGREGDRFVMKGDNNPYDDGYRPTASDILGRLWLGIPGGGNVLLVAQTPPVAATTTGGAVLLATLPVAGKVRGRRRLLRKLRETGRPPRGGSDRGTASVLAPLGQVAVMFTALLTTVAAVGIVASLALPTDRQTSLSLSYTQAGTFSYTAANAPAGLYDSGTAKTGDPIYRRLTPVVAFQFDYRFIASAQAELSGTAALQARLSAPNGWTKVMVLEGSREFEGTSASVGGKLDLNQVQATIDLYHQQTGTGSSDPVQFALALVPVISVTGTLGGAAISQTYSPALPLQYGADQLSMSPASGSGTATDVVQPSTDGKLAATITGANELNLVLVSPKIETVRMLSLVLVPFAAVLILILVALAWRARSVDESVRIRARYSALLVSLRGSAIAGSGQMFDVATMEDLIRVADREGRMVLHETAGLEHTYYVQDADATYRYRTLDRPIGEASATPEVTT